MTGIIILEGLNGAGKSTYAELLSERLKGAPIIRAFRKSTDAHWYSGLKGDERDDDEVAEKLKAAGVPINTFVDDLYAADLIGKICQGPIIMDRSMPSSFVYGTIKGEPLFTSQQADFVWRYWRELMMVSECPITVVHLTVSRDVAKERCDLDARWCPNKRDWERMDRLYESAVRMCRFNKTLRIDTGIHSPDKGVKMILNAYA